MEDFQGRAHSQMVGSRILPEEFLNGRDHMLRLAPPAETNSQAEAAVFNENVQEYQSATIHFLVELKINRPYMVRVFGSQQRSGAV
jgi:hypothetical protein